MLVGDPVRSKVLLGMLWGSQGHLFEFLAASSWIWDRARECHGSFRAMLEACAGCSDGCPRRVLAGVLRRMPPEAPGQGASTDAPGGSWPGVPGVSGGVLGRPRALLWEGLGCTEITDRFLRVSGGGPGGSLGCFWSSGVVLRTDLGDGNVDISLVLVVFLQRVCFSFFFL